MLSGSDTNCYFFLWCNEEKYATADVIPCEENYSRLIEIVSYLGRLKEEYSDLKKNINSKRLRKNILF